MSMKKQSSRLVALLTLIAFSAMSFGAMAPAQAAAHKKGFIRRHPFITAGAAYLVYHHYHKKHQRARARAAQMHRAQ